MKKILLPLVVMLAVLCSGCKSETKTKDSSAQTTAEVKYYRPESESDSQQENVDGIRPNELYYKELYSPVIASELYCGTVENFDYSLLDGYKFVGVIDKKVGENEISDRDLISNFIEEGTPLFYNEEKDSFIWWEQENAYDLTVNAFNN